MLWDKQYKLVTLFIRVLIAYTDQTGKLSPDHINFDAILIINHCYKLTSICHAHPARTIVIKYKIFIIKRLSIDTPTTGTIVIDNVTTCYTAK